MAGGSKQPEERRTGKDAGSYSGPERRKVADRRKVPRRTQARRDAPRRLDERRASGIGEVQDDRRRNDRRKVERRKKVRRANERRNPPPRRQSDRD